MAAVLTDSVHMVSTCQQPDMLLRLSYHQSVIKAVKGNSSCEFYVRRVVATPGKIHKFMTDKTCTCVQCPRHIVQTLSDLE